MIASSGQSGCSSAIDLQNFSKRKCKQNLSRSTASGTDATFILHSLNPNYEQLGWKKHYASNSKSTSQTPNSGTHGENIAFVFVSCINLSKVIISSSHRTDLTFSSLLPWTFNSHATCRSLFCCKACFYHIWLHDIFQYTNTNNFRAIFEIFQ